MAISATHYLLCGLQQKQHHNNLGGGGDTPSNFEQIGPSKCSLYNNGVPCQATATGVAPYHSPPITYHKESSCGQPPRPLLFEQTRCQRVVMVAPACGGMAKERRATEISQPQPQPSPKQHHADIGHSQHHPGKTLAGNVANVLRRCWRHADVVQILCGCREKCDVKSPK